MADATWELDLSLKGAESYEAARQSAKALENSHRELVTQVEITSKSLRVLQQAGLKNEQIYKDMAQRQKAFKKELGLNVLAASKMKGGLQSLVTSQKNLTTSTKQSHLFLGNLSNGMRMAGGPFATLHERAGALTVSLGRAGLAGAAIIALAAIVALEYEIAKATWKIGRFAVTSADAYRSERLELEGLTHSWITMWGIALRPGSAAQLQSDINAVGQNVAIGRDKVKEYAEQLYRMGLRGASATYALKAMAEAGSAAGEGQAQLVKNMALMALYSGQSGAQLYAKVHARFGKIVEQQMLSLDVQSRKLKENLNAIFRGLKIEPLLKGIREELSVFDQGTVTFNAWRGIFGRLFDSLFQQAPKAGNTVKIFLQEVTLYALKAEYAFIKMGGFSKYFKQLKGFSLATLTKAAAGIAVGMLRAVQLSFAFLATMKALVQVLTTVGSLIKSIGMTMAFTTTGGAAVGGDSVASSWKSTLAHAMGLVKNDALDDAIKTGFDIAGGMAKGIEDATPALVEAARKSALQADKAARDEIGAHSPARLSMRTGRDWGRGYALGIRAEAPGIRMSAVQSVRVPPIAAPQVGRSTVNNSRSINFGDINVHNPGNAAAGTAVIPLYELKRLLGIEFENVAIQAGAL